MRYPKTALTKNILSVFLVLTAFLVFQSCKKVDVQNSPTENLQTEDFYKVNDKVPKEVRMIIAQMKTELGSNDVLDFIRWHGQPIWNKVLATSVNRSSQSTYAIPIQKNGEITGFLAARIKGSEKTLG